MYHIIPILGGGYCGREWLSNLPKVTISKWQIQDWSPERLSSVSIPLYIFLHPNL